MKKMMITAAILSMGTGISAQPKEISADSKITEVTVFLTNAQITREAKINLNTGNNTILFEKLSSVIVPGSIQVEGSDQFTIVSVNSSMNYLSEGSERPEVKVMKKELQRVSDEIKLNQQYLSVYQEQMNLLTTNHVFKGENKGITVDDMLSMSELYRKKVWEIQEKIYDCEVKAKRMNMEHSKIQKQVSDLETKFNRYTSTIQLNLTASSKIAANVKITYLVRSAGWSAHYDAKAKDLSTPLELTFKASVYQTTGEDWNNVKLKLSTGNPVKNKTKPELSMWSLYAYDEVVYKNNNKGKKKTAEMSTEYYGGDAGGTAGGTDEVLNEVYLEKELSVIPGVSADKKQESYRRDDTKKYNTNTTANNTTIIETGINAEYDIAIPYTILSDGKENTVEIKKYEMKTFYHHYAVPKLDKDAFLVANITDWEKYNFIPGYVNVYINDTYTGRSYFDSQSVEDTLELSMGRDQSVVISRKKIKDLTGTQVIGGNKKCTMGFDITIRNTRNSALHLKLYDQFPLSNYKEMEITHNETSGAVHNKETGKLEWELDIKAAESKTVKFSYSVKYPKDKMITNLGG